jgi:histidinol-phosphate aminotransferase
MAPKPLPSVLGVEPYKGGESKLPGIAKPIKLASNENPLGASPAAKRAYAEAGERMHLYPDPGARALRAAIAERYGLDANRIVCGAGSDEIFQLLIRAYLGVGDEIIQSRHGFSIYRIFAAVAGGVAKLADERDFTCDVDAFLAHLSPRTKLVFLANPNNPTGTYIPISEVRRLHAGLPKDVILVLDAAYAEYVSRNDYEAGIELASEAENVLMTRTFSKIHGLAGLRVGWAYGPAAIIETLNRVRGPFNAPAPAQAAAAASILDRAFQDKAVAHNAGELARVSAAIAAMGHKLTPSVGNFVLVHFGAGEAAKIDAHLRSRGLIVRRMDSYFLPDALRISIGTVEENTALLAALSDYGKGAA